ncbi:suppressor of fused domain protein [Acinetobacter venetianus]|uniref:suppressor of fused domain protein n=1 Tax=Acinetobacter venetianus TaxID=52133 RepID=UPI0007783FA7|nr:suppressor of fused domain protein [Acinetobacter venetianus]KXZ64253.1 Antitoxin YqcF [Acinetobacter venetianus]
MQQNFLENKKIAETLTHVFNGTPSIFRYWDEPKENFIDIFISTGCLSPELTAYATIGLSDFPNLVGPNKLDIRVEIIGICLSDSESFANVLSTAAFCIINLQWPCYPTSIFPNILSMYDCSRTMQHLFFTDPFLWEDQLKTLNLETKTVAWLLAVPISEAEYRYAAEHGAEQLEKLLAKYQIDVTDINRASIF